MVAYVNRGDVVVGDWVRLELYKDDMENKRLQVLQVSQVLEVKPSVHHKYEEMDEIKF